MLADFADLDALNNRSNAAGVTARLELETEDVKAGGRSLRFRAANTGGSARGAWAQIGTVYEHPYFSMLPGEALGLWVKGDGSGALLNVQIRSPREYHDCISDHYIDLDFTGWRYVELLLRERDAERMSDYVWPYQRRRRKPRRVPERRGSAAYFASQPAAERNPGRGRSRHPRESDPLAAHPPGGAGKPVARNSAEPR